MHEQLVPEVSTSYKLKIGEQIIQFFFCKTIIKLSRLMYKKSFGIQLYLAINKKHRGKAAGLN